VALIFCLQACGRAPEVGKNGEIVKPSLPCLFFGVKCTSKILSLDDALEKLSTANIAFNTREKAQVGKLFIVEAKLSRRLRQEKLKVLIEEPGKREVASLKVSDRMSAMLSGGRIRASN